MGDITLITRLQYTTFILVLHTRTLGGFNMLIHLSFWIVPSHKARRDYSN